MKILIFGSSGLTGQALVKHLANDECHDEIHLALRKPLPLMTHPRVHQHIIDFSSTEAIIELVTQGNFELAFCALGTTIKKAGSKQAFKHIDVDLISMIGESVTKSHSINCFCFISALGANANSSVFYNRCKGQTENNIIEHFNIANAERVANRQTTQKLIVCRPSLLTGDRDEFRLGEKIGIVLSQCAPFIFRGPLKQYKPIDASILAQAMIRKSTCKGLKESDIETCENDELHKLGQATN